MDHVSCAASEEVAGTGWFMMYLDRSRAFSTSSWEARSTLRIVAPSARDKPVPLAAQSRLAKAFKTCRPRSPVAPVINAVLSAISVCVARTSVLGLWSRYECGVLLRKEGAGGAVIPCLLH